MNIKFLWGRNEEILSVDEETSLNFFGCECSVDVILRYCNIAILLKTNPYKIGASKNDSSLKKLNNIANLCKTFGHPARVSIIEQ